MKNPRKIHTAYAPTRIAPAGEAAAFIADAAAAVAGMNLEAYAALTTLAVSLGEFSGVIAGSDANGVSAGVWESRGHAEREDMFSSSF